MSYRSKRVLVTGGAGFIGSEVVRQLAADGAHVTVLTNLANGKRENLVDVPAEHLALVVGDVRDAALAAELMRTTEIVFHLATLGLRHSLHSPEENHEVNATATLRLLAAARNAGVQRFVHVSSSEVYGTAQTVPMTEEHPTMPTTVYGAAKLAGEAYARAYHRTYGFPAVVIRPFNTYGPRSHHERDSGEVIPKFMLRSLAGRPLIIFGDGSQTRDFTYVSDTAAGILAAGLAEGVAGETINLGAGRETSMRDLADAVARVVGQRVEIQHESARPADVLRHCAGTAKAQRLLGYRPRVAIDEGLGRLRDWYLSLKQSPAELLQSEVVRNWEKGQSTG